MKIGREKASPVIRPRSIADLDREPAQIARDRAPPTALGPMILRVSPGATGYPLADDRCAGQPWINSSATVGQRLMLATVRRELIA